MKETGLPPFSEKITHSPHMKTFRNYKQVSVQFFQQLSIDLLFNILKFLHVTEAVHFLLYYLIGLGISYLVFWELEGSDQCWHSTHSSAIHSFPVSRRNHWRHFRNIADTKYQGNITKSTTALLTFLKTAAAHSYLLFYISSSTVLGSCLFFSTTCSHSYFSVYSDDQAVKGHPKSALEL